VGAHLLQFAVYTHAGRWLSPFDPLTPSSVRLIQRSRQAWCDHPWRSTKQWPTDDLPGLRCVLL